MATANYGNIFGSVTSGLFQMWSIGSANKHSRRMAEYEKAQRDAAAQTRNAQAGLAQFMTNLNNNRRLRAGSEQLSAANRTLWRHKDQLTGRRLEDQLGAAEALGAYAANVASKGMAGGSVDAIDRTMRMKQARQEQYKRTRENDITYDMVQQISGIMPATIQGLDNTVYSHTKDNSEIVANTKNVDFMGIMGKAGIWDNLFSVLGSNLGPRPMEATGTGLTGGHLGLKPGTGETGFFYPKANQPSGDTYSLL